MEKDLKITINNKQYSKREILEDSLTTTPFFERKIIAFCRQWIADNDTFTLTTSGTSGQPKKIILSRKQMTINAIRIAKILGLQSGQTALLCLSPEYIAGQMMIVRSFVSKLNLYAIEPCRNPFEKIPNHITLDVASFVPYQLDAILKSNHKKKIDTLHCVLLGGAPISPQLQKKIEEIPCSLYATYGMTETAATIALQRLNGASRQPHFHTLPGIRIKQNNQQCLVVDADYIGHPIVTNDLIEIKDPTSFRWLGRKDNVINSGGVKIVPEQVELQLTTIFDELNLNNRFFVTGITDSDLGEKLVLLIEGIPFSGNKQEVIIQKIKNLMLAYHHPKKIYFVTHFIQTESGKINRIKTKKLGLRFQ